MRKIYFLLASVLFSGIAMGQAFSEDFEDGEPSGWTFGDYWDVSSTPLFCSNAFCPPSHTDYAGVNDDQGGNPGDDIHESIITPEINLMGYEALVLNFEAYFVDGDYDGDEQAKVYASIDAGETWEQIHNMVGSGGWQAVYVDISEYAGESAVQFMFDYDDDGGWEFGFAIDDVVIQEPLMYDLKVVFATTGVGTKGLIGTEREVVCEIFNGGTETVTSFDVTLTVDGTEYIETIDGVEIAAYETYQFTTGNAVEYGDGVTEWMLVASAPNGEEDQAPGNNEIDGAVEGVMAAAGRGILFEEATGTWCTWCTRGHAWMEYMNDCFGEHFVGVAVHNGDPMVIPAYDNAMQIGGYPSAIYEKDTELDPSEFENYIMTKLNTPPAVSISIDNVAFASNGEAFVDVTYTFNQNMSGNFRVGGVIMEDDVTGSASAWNQINAYAGGGNGYMGGYESLPSPVPASTMVYEDVARCLMGGYLGYDNMIPSSPASGSSYSVTLSGNMSYWSQVDPSNIRAAAYLVDGSGEVVNAAQWSGAVGIDGAAAVKPEILIYPNPFNNVTNIKVNLEQSSDVQVDIFDALGRTVLNKDYGQLMGEMLLPFNGASLDAGVYYVRVTIDGVPTTKAVNLIK